LRPFYFTPYKGNLLELCEQLEDKSTININKLVLENNKNNSLDYTQAMATTIQTRENAIVELPDYQILVTQLV